MKRSVQIRPAELRSGMVAGLVRVLWSIVLLGLANSGCGGSSSETPPPLPPHRAGQLSRESSGAEARKNAKTVGAAENFPASTGSRTVNPYVVSAPPVPSWGTAPGSRGSSIRATPSGSLPQWAPLQGVPSGDTPLNQ